MTSQVDAVYENGVFRPLEPVNLPEQQRVRVTVSNDAEFPEYADFAISQDRWQRFCDALDAPPKVIPALRRLFAEKTVLDGNS